MFVLFDRAQSEKASLCMNGVMFWNDETKYGF